MKRFLSATAIALLLLSGCAMAAKSALLDKKFNAGTRFDAYPGVSALCPLPDGKLLVGCTFFSWDWDNQPGLVRLTSAGELDPSFKADLGPHARAVRDIIRLPDGRLFVCGGIPGSIIMLHADGRRDNSFLMGRGTKNGEIWGTVTSVIRLPNGKFLIAGSITGVGSSSVNDPGTPRTGIARLNADGSLDKTFNPQLRASSAFSEQVNVIRIERENITGKILMAGMFTHVEGQPRQGMARLHPDGSLDLSFTPSFKSGSPEANNAYIHTMALQPDGKVIVSGFVQQADGAPSLGLVRLNRDGSVDTAFSSALAAQTNTFFSSNAISVLEDGKLLIASDGFSSYKNGKYSGLFRLHPDGTLDKDLPRTSIAGTIRVMRMDKAGRMLMGGDLRGVDRAERLGVARIFPDAVLDFSIKARSASPAMGSVTGGGTYLANRPATVIARAKPGRSFVCWRDGRRRVSQNATYTFTVRHNRVLVAYFK